MDPLALDLNGDGRISTCASSASAAYFDFNDDGISERSGWIAGGDGLLALDANGNGMVDGLGELFGTAAMDGFAELTTLDANHDSVVDAADAAFAGLLVWRDADGDGVSDVGELATPAALGIEGFRLEARPVSLDDGDNRIIAVGRPRSTPRSSPCLGCAAMAASRACRSPTRRIRRCARRRQR